MSAQSNRILHGEMKWFTRSTTARSWGNFVGLY